MSATCAARATLSMGAGTEGDEAAGRGWGRRCCGPPGCVRAPPPRPGRGEKPQDPLTED